MTTIVPVLRLVAGLAITTAIIATFLDTASRVTINPFNFFGYFTLQSNIIAAVVLLIAGAVGLSSRPQSRFLVIARAAATTYMIIVGIVYAILLAPLGAAGGVPLPWANLVLHVVVPIYVAVDWLLFADRPRLSFRSFWVVLVFPVVWVAVVLFRGAADGWFPYPFLDPSLGYGTILLYCCAIAAAVIVVGAGVWALSRVRLLRV
ncbi:MAG: Pr6Pr family membrane protein [Microbacteriaceae bacterium]